jgi:putative hemolysin
MCEAERETSLEDDSRGASTPRNRFALHAFVIGMSMLLLLGRIQGATANEQSAGDTGPGVFTPGVVTAIVVLLVFSAFFSACEVAFFSLHKLRVRGMQQSGRALDRLAARMLEHPGDLLTSILMGNSIVNVMLGVVLATRVEEYLYRQYFPDNELIAYLAAVAVGTGVLVFFGEVMPKLMVVRQGDVFARYASVPLYVVDKILIPIRKSVIRLIGLLFRVTRFSEVKPAPFMTDDEFLSLLSEGEATGAIERDEREMIEGILEFGDVTVREILVPRPDMVALPETATAGDALALLRDHEFSRMPVYKETIDKIVGVLFAKDLLPCVDEDTLDAPIFPMLRKPHYVPETMSVADFMRTSQRSRMHLAIVADEYGGTEGLVTLQDALREIVGNVGEEEESQEEIPTMVSPGVFRVSGSFPLDELEELSGVQVEDSEHTTVAGFLMSMSDKILVEGDIVEHAGVIFRIEEVDGKRVANVRIQVVSSEHAVRGGNPQAVKDDVRSVGGAER